MPWSTPTLRQVRTMVRDDVIASLSGATQIGNSVLRVLADATGGLAHLTLRYVDWLARQLLPDTAETEWLDRHGTIWLRNSDGTKGRKAATFASGTVTMTGEQGAIIASGTQLSAAVLYETTDEIVIGSAETAVPVRALESGVIGNLDPGDNLEVVSVVNSSVDGNATVVTVDGGTDQESDDLLRERILFRIQNPPMGGSQADYVRWAMAVPGVTRAWAAAELGPGTMTVRFLMDDLYPEVHGLPTNKDIETVSNYLDLNRPVTVKDCFVLAPTLYPYDITISNLTVDNTTVRARIEASLKEKEALRSKPGQTWYRSWVDEAISQAVGEETHELDYETTVMPTPADMPVLGTVLYV